MFREWEWRLGVTHLVTSAEHPQTNGQVEAANMIILKALRTRLDNSKGLWKEELPSILFNASNPCSKEGLYTLWYSLFNNKIQGK